MLATVTAEPEAANTIDRIPLSVRFEEPRQFTETYGFAGSSAAVMLEGQLLCPRDRPSRTLVVFMHPTSNLALLPYPNALARSGCHVLCCDSRYPRNDAALIMEKVVVDLGAWIRHAKSALGYRTVVLAGWSGGGALALFYQAEAERPTITTTPAGDPADLAAAELVPADALLIVAAHLSRAKTLTEWIDPSVSDEFDPDRREIGLDLYDPRNPNKPPYSAAYVALFRGAQIGRNQRITAWARERLEDLRRRGTGEMERAFVVHRTMADPRWLDPTLEPNDRKSGWCYLGDPRVVNTGPVGLARFSTLRAWLSQWSYSESRADGPRSARRVSPPALVIENSADDACPASHARALFEAIASKDKEMRVVHGATHYYLDQPRELAQAVTLTADWLGRKNLIGG